MSSQSIPDRAASWFRELQDRICRALEDLDGTARFREDVWERQGSGGGRSRVLEGGATFEKAGVNFTDVHGELPPELAATTPGEGNAFRATGISLVIHPESPMIPTVHANFRCLEKAGTIWFGGGCDLTPCYPFRDDVIHFHREWKSVCDLHDPSYYPRFKKTCDDYFYLPHRDETRGVGGIFFDFLQGDLEHAFAFVRDAGETFVPAYVPIVERRKAEPWSDREREFHLYRRGRFVEFNLLLDRGTVFGLRTGGRAESILLSLPPLARWVYAYAPEPGSREAKLAEFLKPTDWLADIQEVVGSS
jgi:coproporphyrinogen III oxidase